MPERSIQSGPFAGRVSGVMKSGIEARFYLSDEAMNQRARPRELPFEEKRFAETFIDAFL